MSFKSYILALMKDERNDVFDTIVKGVLRLLSWVYTLAVKIVDFSYKSGLRREHKAGAIVISVGNITLGGTGKTPFTIFLADHFQAMGINCAILTRGYGNDENKMIKDELPDISVFVGQDRVTSAQLAVSEGKDVLILDDGFQHRRIARDLNILMLDSTKMFGNRFLLPRGTLREPIRSLKRADFFMLSKTDRINEEQKEEIMRQLNTTFPGKPVVSTRHKPSFLTDVTGSAHSIDSLCGKKVMLLSGIADPDYFAFLVEQTGAAIISRLDYPDHHCYRQMDIGKVYAKCATENIEAIIVTKKDHVKLKELDISSIEDKVFVMNIIVDIVRGKERLVARLNSIVSD